MTKEPPSGEIETDQVIRDAILRELHRQTEDGEGGVAEYVELIARRLVEKAAGGDIQAIKEVLRIEDTATAGEAPRKATIEWLDSGSSSVTDPADNSCPSTIGYSGSPAS